MAKSLSVKIPTQALIEEIEKNIKKVKEEIRTYDDRLAQYETSVKLHEEIKIKMALNAVVANQNNLAWGDYSYRATKDTPVSASVDYRGNVAIYVDLDKEDFPKPPEKPENPNEKSYYGREYVTKLDLLKRNLKILKMTNQSTVSASTYNSVMELL